MYPWSEYPPLSVRIALGRAGLAQLWIDHGWASFGEGVLAAVLVILVFDYLTRRGRR